MLLKRACCFCGEIIERTDTAALEITLSNLWHRDAIQGLQAHSVCASSAFPDRAMVDPECLID